MAEEMGVKAICKSCEEIVKPRAIYDDRGRETNSECPECGNYIGRFDGTNHEFVYAGQDEEDDAVYIRWAVGEGEDAEMPAVEDFQ